MKKTFKCTTFMILLGFLMSVKIANAQAIIAGDKFSCRAFAYSVNDGPYIETQNAKPTIQEYNPPFLSAVYPHSPQTVVSFNGIRFNSNAEETDQGVRFKVTRFLDQKQDSMQSLQLILDNKRKLSMNTLSRDSNGFLKMFYQCEFIKR